jgi:hypothetical protein
MIFLKCYIEYRKLFVFCERMLMSEGGKISGLEKSINWLSPVLP